MYLGISHCVQTDDHLNLSSFSTVRLNIFYILGYLHLKMWFLPVHIQKVSDSSQNTLGILYGYIIYSEVKSMLRYMIFIFRTSDAKGKMFY